MHSRSAKPAATPIDRYSGRTFVGVAGREALVLDSRANGLTITGLRCTGGSTCLRLIECGDITLIEPVLRQPMGPGDSAGGSDGQCISIVRPTGPIRIIRPRFVGSPAAEDLLGIFADKPCKGSVYLEDAEFYGRGTSDSSTSICVDGPSAIPTVIKGGTIDGARCGVTVASPSVVSIAGLAFTGCETKIFVEVGYGSPPSVTLSGYAAGDVLIGDGMPAGAVVMR